MRTELPKPGEMLDLYGGRRLGNFQRLEGESGGVDVFYFREKTSETCVASFDAGFFFGVQVDDEGVKTSFFEGLFCLYDRKTGELRSCRVDLLWGLLNGEAMGVPFSNEIHENMMDMSRRDISVSLMVVTDKKETKLSFYQTDGEGSKALLGSYEVTERNFGNDEKTGFPVEYVSMTDEGESEVARETRLAAWRGKLPLFPEVEIALAVYETFVVFIINSDLDELSISYPINRRVDVSGLNAKRLDFELAKKLVRQSFRGINF